MVKNEEKKIYLHPMSSQLFFRNKSSYLLGIRQVPSIDKSSILFH